MLLTAFHVATVKPYIKYRTERAYDWLDDVLGMR